MFTSNAKKYNIIIFLMVVILVASWFVAICGIRNECCQCYNTSVPSCNQVAVLAGEMTLFFELQICGKMNVESQTVRPHPTDSIFRPPQA